MKIISEHIKPILSLMIVVLTFVYFFSVLILEQKSNDQIIIAIVAAMSGATGYYFGNSQGSARKDDVIAGIANTPKATVTNADTVNIDKSLDK